MKKGSIIFVIVLLSILIGSWMWGSWAKVPVSIRYQPLVEDQLSSARAAEKINQEPPGVVPEYEVISNVSNLAVAIHTLYLEDNSNDSNVHGEVNFLTKKFTTAQERITYQLNRGQVLPVDDRRPELKGILPLVYRQAKENQKSIGKEKNKILWRSFISIIAVILGLITIKYAREIATATIRMTIKNAEPSNFLVFLQGLSGILMIGLGLYFVYVFTILLLE